MVSTACGNVDIVNRSKSGNPLRTGLAPLLTVNVWEHAHYIDYLNARLKYLDAIWSIIDWNFVATNVGGIETLSPAITGNNDRNQPFLTLKTHPDSN